MKNSSKGSIHLFQAIALYIGAVLGAGILIVPGLAAETAGPASLIDWGGFILLVVPLALCMAYLSEKYPHAGGVAHFVAKAFGPKTATMVGWFFLMSVPIGAPVAALTGAGYFTAAFHGSNRTTLFLAGGVLALALLLNYLGMMVAGKVQIVVVAGILGVLGLTIIGAVPHLDAAHFHPFMPRGMLGVGRASTLLFWCFIGWEAVANLSAEFVHPEKDIRRATVIAAVLLSSVYFLAAFTVIGTGSAHQHAQAALVHVAQLGFGRTGAVLIGSAGLLICLATVIAYTGAACRLAAALAKQGQAWKWLAKRSQKFHTPLGGLLFLLICFLTVMTVYALHFISLSELIRLPNAAFLLNYGGGCLAGAVLFKHEPKKRLVSLISLVAIVIMLIFVGLGIIYPMVIFLVVVAGRQMGKKKRLERKLPRHYKG
jgi:amino acid efflux transporter